MLGLFGEDPNDPPPRFTFSALLALIASAYTFYLEMRAGWEVLSVHPDYLLYTLVGAMFMVGAPFIATIILCVVSMIFSPIRWGLIALGILCLAPLLLCLAAVLGLTH